MLTDQQISELFEKLTRLEKAVIDLSEKVDQISEGQQKIEDWVPEQVTQKLTGLSRGTLLKLRKDGLVSSSTFSGKSPWYRYSSLIKLLNQNEEKI